MIDMIGKGIIPGIVDPDTGAAVAIEYGHSRIHAGFSFHSFANDLDLDTDETLTLAFKTPSGSPCAHVVPLVSASTGIRLEVLEAPTITVDTGSQIDAVNRNRNSSNLSTVETIETVPQAGKVTLNPTITADGLAIQNLISGGVGAGPIKGSEGSSRDLGELELKLDTVYAFRVTSLDDNNQVNLDLVWYELEH